MAEPKIIKVEENKVQYTPVKILKSTDGKDVEVYNNNQMEIYGQNRIDSEKDAFQKMYDFWNTITPTVINEKKQSALDRISKLNDIQDAMDGPVSQEN